MANSNKISTRQLVSMAMLGAISIVLVSAIHFPISSQSEIIPKILQYSNDSHIYKEGLPTRYNNGMHI